MLFNTTQFFIFLAVVLALFYSSPRRFRRYILLAASYFFYACWNYKFIALLLTLTAIDYTAGIWLEKVPPGPQEKALLILSLSANLGFLGFFKYYNFLAGNLALLLGEAQPLVLAGHRSSLGHQLSHLPEHVLRGGRVSRRAEGRAQPDRLRAVHLLFPATGGGTDCPGAHFLPRPFPLAAALGRRCFERHSPDGAGPDQEDGVRRPVRQGRQQLLQRCRRKPGDGHRLERRVGVRAADLLRFLGIHGHGDRDGEAARASIFR